MSVNSLPSQPDIQPCFCQAGGFGVYILYQTMCYLGVVGTQSGQVNKPLLELAFGLFLSHYLLSFCSLLMSFPPSFYLPLIWFFSILHVSLFLLPLPVCQWPISSHAWEKLCGIPWKTPDRAEKDGGGGEFLTQHIYSTVDILVFLAVTG